MKIKLEQIISTSKEIVEKEGFEALSIREIARRLHVQPGALYNHVKNLDEVKYLGGKALLQELNTSLETAKTVKEWIMAYYDFLSVHPELVTQAHFFSKMGNLRSLSEVHAQYEHLIELIPQEEKLLPRFIFPFLFGSQLLNNDKRDQFEILLDQFLAKFSTR